MSSQASRYDALIVGAGHGGVQAAGALRQHGFGGSIGLIDEETAPPYERPPLSKDYLSGEKTFSDIQLRSRSFWREQAIDLLLGRRVVSVDPDAHSVEFSTGEPLGYGRLIWAAGGSPRRPTCPGADLKGVHVVRTRTDVNRLRDDLESAKDAVIVGGGYIGLETAAVLRKLGKRVSLVETQGRVLSRVAGEQLARFFEREHRSHGVDLRLGARCVRFLGAGNRLSAVELENGEYLPAQVAVVGIGIDPVVEPLRRAGAGGSDGVDVDAFGATSLADVYALGDCAAHVSRYGNGARVRIESVQNANDQATTVAKAIVGSGAPYDALPWFWSDQYDLKLRSLGLSAGHDEAVVRGDPGTRSFSVVYLKAGRVIALDCVNALRDFTRGRALIGTMAPRDRRVLGDASRGLVASVG